MRRNTLIKIGNIVNEAIKEEFALQGHTLTGDMEQSMELTTDVNSIVCIANKYANYLNIGVKAEQIKYPFAKARINGLTKFVQLRITSDEKEARGIAYAIASKHAQEGMPTSASARFSSTGKRTDYIDLAIGKVQEQIIDAISEEFLIDIGKVTVAGR